MSDPELVAFLQWALPRVGLRWQGYRNIITAHRVAIGASVERA
jgi:hypothetical protein